MELSRKYILFLLFYILTFKIDSQPLVKSDENYFSLKSKNFIIHYPKPYKNIAQEFLRIAEEVHNQLEPQYKSKAYLTHFVLVFHQDIANAYTTAYGMDHIIFFISQPELFSFANYDDWIKQLIVHEYTHILTLRQYYGFWNYLWRILTGNPPNHALPDGILEGIPVFEESENLNNVYVGRIYDTRTNSIFRYQLLYGNFPYYEEMLGGSYRWPLGELVYLYGGRYTNFIIKEYSKEKYLEIFHSESLPIFLNKRFIKAGLELPEDIYNKFIKNENDFMEKWIDNKFKKYTTIEERISFDGGIKKYIKVHNNQLYYFSKNYSRSAGIYKIDTENFNSEIVYKAIDINDFFVVKTTIITSEPRYLNGSNIIHYNIYRNSRKVFYDFQRRHYPYFYNQSLYFFKYHDPYIYLITYENNQENIISKFDFHHQVSSIMIANNKIYFILKEKYSTRHFLMECFIIEKKCKPIVSSQYRINSLFIYNDYIFFNCDLDGNFEIYKLNLNNQTIIKITNSLIPKSFPVFYKGYLYFLGENTSGFDLYRIKESYLVNFDYTEKFDFGKIPDKISDNFSEISYKESPYTLKNFNIFLDGILRDVSSNIYLQVTGFDPLKRHILNLGILFNFYQDVYFINYIYNRFLPNINFSFFRTNPFHKDKNCYKLANEFIKSYLCNKTFGQEKYILNFQYPYYFRLLKNYGELGFSISRIRNAFSLIESKYNFENFDQKSFYFTYKIWYYEQYIYSISPESGWSFSSRFEHFPYRWNYIKNQNSKTFYEYTVISLRGEIFIPWFIKNHVPYISVFSTYNKGKHYDFVKNNLAKYQYGLDYNRSTYGTGSIVQTYEYRFPLVYLSKRILPFLPEFGIHYIALSPFYQTGKSFNKNIYEKNPIFHSRGIRINTKLYLFYLPFDFIFIYSSGNEEQYSFGISFNQNFNAQIPMEKLYPETLSSIK